MYALSKRTEFTCSVRLSVFFSLYHISLLLVCVFSFIPPAVFVSFLLFFFRCTSDGEKSVRKELASTSNPIHFLFVDTLDAHKFASRQRKWLPTWREKQEDAYLHLHLILLLLFFTFGPSSDLLRIPLFFLEAHLSSLTESSTFTNQSLPLQSRRENRHIPSHVNSLWVTQRNSSSSSS